MMKRIAITAALSGTLFVCASPAPAQRVSVELAGGGWIGVDIRGEDEAGNKLEYPVIVFVQDNSPAEKAGIVKGDTVLQFGSVDAHSDPYALRRLLTPGHKLKLKLRNNGVRYVTVNPRKRDDVSVSDPFEGLIALSGITQMPAPIAAPTTVTIRLSTVVAGARLEPMNGDLAEALRVQNLGAFVVEVVPETPAMRSGLKAGDVIIKADARRVNDPSTVATLFRAVSAKTVQSSSSRHLTLDVMRVGKQHTVQLRW